MRSRAEWFREARLDPEKYVNCTAEDALREPISATELMESDLPEPDWVIEDILPVGVTLLIGKPKKGKGWMGLGMCVAVAAGGKAFGIKGVRQGEALYLALEDYERRLKKRLKKALNGALTLKGDIPTRVSGSITSVICGQKERNRDTLPHPAQYLSVLYKLPLEARGGTLPGLRRSVTYAAWLAGDQPSPEH